MKRWLLVTLCPALGGALLVACICEHDTTIIINDGEPEPTTPCMIDLDAGPNDPSQDAMPTTVSCTEPAPTAPAQACQWKDPAMCADGSAP